MSLEDEGNYAGAEEHFVRANKHREAVLMYVHAKVRFYSTAFIFEPSCFLKLSL